MCVGNLPVAGMGFVAGKGIERRDPALFVERFKDRPKILTEHGVLPTPRTEVQYRARQPDNLTIKIGNRQHPR
ncbi:hypothetical protein D3C77_747130 [compost metagenome]